MYQTYTLKEYLKFIKKYRKTILYTIIVAIILLLAGRVAQTFIGQNTNPQTVEEPVENQVTLTKEKAQELLNSDFELLAEDQQNELINYLNQEAYLFRVYMETEYAEPFTDHRTLKSFLSTDRIENEIESSTSVELLPDIHRALRLQKDNNANVITVLVGVGNKNSNKRLIDEFYQIFENQTLDFFNNKIVYLLDESPVHYSDVVQDEDMPIDEIQVETQPQGTNIVLVILSIIIATVIGIIISFIKNYYSDQISYLFNYGLLKNERLIKVGDLSSDTNKSMSEMLVHIFKDISYNNKSMIVQENFNEIQNMLNSHKADTKVYGTISEVVKKDFGDISEVFIFVKLNETDKDWYKQQLEIARYHEIKVTVVEVS